MCEGKAALVLRGRAARVEGLVFTHMRVEDGNGAGIRIEQGDLEVSQTMFVDGQCGILSAADPNGTISIDHSTFSRLGKHPDGNGAHALYVGQYGALRVTNSRFERGTGGHYLKSRAPRVEIVGNSFDDSQGQDTNYMIDLPEGAVGRIAGNTFVQGHRQGELRHLDRRPCRGGRPSERRAGDRGQCRLGRAGLSLDHGLRRRLERRGAGDPRQPPRPAHHGVRAALPLA